MRRSVPASPSLSLAISVSLHALAAVLFARVGPWRSVAERSPAVEASVEVELVETTPALESKPGPEPPAPAPPLRPLDPRRPPSPAVLPPAPKTAPGIPTPAPVAPSSTAANPPPRARPPVSLAIDFRTLDRLSHQGVLEKSEPGATPPPPEATRASTFGERLAARVRQDGARRNVAAGKVHPQVFDYMRDARKVFAPDPGTVDLDPRTPNTVRSSLRQWGGGVREAYKSWRRDLDDLRARQRFDELDRRGIPDVLEHYNRLLEGNRKGAEAIASQVCLLVAPGATPRVELGQSSQNDEVDRAAVDALSRAARRRQPEPDLRKQRTCYRFAVKVVRVPPLPVAGCMFDEVELTASCYYPLKKGMTMSVSLDSVDYD